MQIFKVIKLHMQMHELQMQMHHLHAGHEVYSPTYKKWLDIKAPYIGSIMEAKDVEE